MHVPLRLLAVGLLAPFGAALDGCKDSCAEPTEADLASLPDRLSQTGLLGDGVIAFAPAFALWSDGATKKRSILLPAGAQIDTSDMDDWRFPAGTTIWKEFVRDDVRLETRLLLKTGPSDDAWVAAAYLWDGDDARLLPEGAENVNGTKHNVPTAAKCRACHGGRASFVLGFSAVQLANVDPVGEGAFTLDDAIARGLLSDPPADSAALRVPGEAHERAALGYLHANCAHCHNQDRPQRDGPRCYDPERDFDMLLRAGQRAVEDTATYRTLVSGEDDIVVAGDPDESELVSRMESRSADSIASDQMPPLASEEVDHEGVAIIRAWIVSL